MTKTIIPIIILCVLWGCSSQVLEKEVYLFSFFQNNGADGLHLAYSENALNWHPLNDNESILTPQVGDAKLMRDPCIIIGGDGKFHMVWTAGWNEQGIGYASSEDLINWSEQQFIPVMEHEPEVLNTWAPEIYFDEDSETYMIYWASTIPGRFPETDHAGDDDYNHRMYYTTTKNFIKYTDTKVLYDDGFNVIDATIHKVDDEYVIFLKDETRYPEAEKNIRIAKSDQFYEGYSSASAPITDNWVEGPTAIETDSGWVVYFDRYTDGEMGAIRSADLENWIDISDKISFPDGTRHGTVFKAKEYILNDLKSSFNK